MKVAHAQAEAFCNSKFFDHYYEALIEGLRRPMRKVLKDIRRANRKAVEISTKNT